MLIGKIVQNIRQYHNSAFTSIKCTTVLLTKLYWCILIRTKAITPWKSLIILHLLHNHWKQMFFSLNFAISYHLRLKKKKEEEEQVLYACKGKTFLSEYFLACSSKLMHIFIFYCCVLSDDMYVNMHLNI